MLSPRLHRPREFKIETYYYDQDKADEDPKRRIKFKRIRHSKPVQRTNPVRLLMIIILLGFVIYYLQKKAPDISRESQPDKIIVEEVIVID